MLPYPVLSIIYLILIFTSFLCSVTVYFRKTNFGYLKFFSPFLLATLIIEILGSFKGGNAEFNKVYSVFTIIEVVFYLSILYRVTRDQLMKKALIIATIAYPPLAILNIAFIQSLSYSPNNSMLGSLLIVGFCIYCFNELFKAVSLLEIVRNPAFWICIGLVLFYSCTFPIWAGIELLKNLPGETMGILALVLYVSNLILYSSFSMAFLCEVIFRRSKTK